VATVFGVTAGTVRNSARVGVLRPLRIEGMRRYRAADIELTGATPSAGRRAI
jgi:hypothetical protein